MPRAADAFAGFALGLLTGLLVGLSSTPVVGGVVGALTAVIAGFFGLTSAPLTPDPLRIGSFGCAAVIGLAFGLHVRAQDLTALTVREEVRRWTDAGYAPDAARDIVAFARYGIRPAGREIGPPPHPLSSLFAGQASLCGRLQTLPPEAQSRLLREAARDADAAPALRALVVALDNAPEHIADMVQALCGG